MYFFKIRRIRFRRIGTEPGEGTPYRPKCIVSRKRWLGWIQTHMTLYFKPRHRPWVITILILWQTDARWRSILPRISNYWSTSIPISIRWNQNNKCALACSRATKTRQIACAGDSHESANVGKTWQYMQAYTISVWRRLYNVMVCIGLDESAGTGTLASRLHALFACYLNCGRILIYIRPCHDLLRVMLSL